MEDVENLTRMSISSLVEYLDALRNKYISSEYESSIASQNDLEIEINRVTVEVNSRKSQIIN